MLYVHFVHIREVRPRELICREDREGREFFTRADQVAQKKSGFQPGWFRWRALRPTSSRAATRRRF
jgi:hypothetical protein